MPYADSGKERDYQRAYQRAWVKARAERWRAAGACTRCGTPVEKFVRCAKCRAYYSRYHGGKQRAKRMTKRCPNHPRNWMHHTAKQCRVCQVRQAQAAKMAKNLTIGPVRQLLKQGPHTLPQLRRLVGRSHTSVRNALRRLMREEGLVEDRSAMVPVYRFVREQAA